MPVKLRQERKGEAIIQDLGHFCIDQGSWLQSSCMANTFQESAIKYRESTHILKQSPTWDSEATVYPPATSVLPDLENKTKLCLTMSGVCCVASW